MATRFLTWIRNLFTAPIAEDDEKTRIARLLHTVLLTFCAVVIVVTASIPLLYGVPGSFEESFTLLAGIVIAAVSIGLLLLARYGYTRVASLILVSTLWIVMTTWICGFSGLGGDTSILTYPLIIALAGLLLGKRGAIVSALLSILAVAGVYYAEISGAVEFPTRTIGPFDLVVTITVLGLMGLLLRHAVQNTAEAFEHARRSKRGLEESNRELHTTRASLEQHNEYLQAMVQAYVDHMSEVVRGNLSAQLLLDEKRGSDDLLLVLGHNLNETTANLQRMTTQVRDAANNLGSAAAEILAATSQQAASAGEQSAAVAQASSTIDEVRAIAEQTSQRAQSVADLAQRTAQVAHTGQQAVTDTIQGMEQVKERVESIASDILALSEQTQAIGGIIATVNEIAAQSNLLALNAAVEAARAGEAGKGFAVVAQEVRSLAEQSRAATDQVKEILSQVQRGVNTAVMATEEGMKQADVGMKLAGEAGLAIQDLANGVTESTQAALQIAAAAGQQLTGMEQIAQAMDNIHRVTAQSVASARQVEKAAEELNGLAGQLRALVEQYRL